MSAGQPAGSAGRGGLQPFDTPHFDPLYIVDGTGSDQLTDGTAAGIIHLHTNPQNTLNVGANLVDDTLVTKGDTGVMVTLLCPAASVATCLPALLPYARTIDLTVSS